MSRKYCIELAVTFFKGAWIMVSVVVEVIYFILHINVQNPNKISFFFNISHFTSIRDNLSTEQLTDKNLYMDHLCKKILYSILISDSCHY